MMTTAIAGLIPSHEASTSSGASHMVAGPATGAICTAFPGSLTGTWIGSGAASCQTDTHMSMIAPETGA